MTELTADDYEYRLPDHWVHHALFPDDQFSRLHTSYVQRTIDLIKASGAKTVLEVGCGDGWNCGQMVEQGLEVAGTDWSRNAIAHARQLVPKARFHNGDIRDGDFIKQFPNPFDAVALIEVIEHIPIDDTVEAVRKIIAPLKRGGLFVLTTPSTNTPNTNPQHYRHFTEATLLSILAEVGGLKVQSVEGYGDVVADRAYWAKMRWANNSLYTIKPLAKYLTRRHAFEAQTPLERSAGIIVAAKKL